MEIESIKSINRNIIGAVVGICIFICACFMIHAFAERERFETSQKSIQVLTAKVDTLRTEIKGYYQVIHQSIQKTDTVKINRYSEQCRVDSIQDAFLDKLNIRTLPLLMNKN